MTASPSLSRAPRPRLYLPNGEPDPRAIRKMRLAHGLSLADLGKLLHVDESTVCRWEYGTAFPQPRHRAVIHNFLAASAAIMERHEGVIPPEHSFRRHLSSPQYDAHRAWELEAENHMLKQAVVGALGELETQVALLRSMVSHELPAMAGDY